MNPQTEPIRLTFRCPKCGHRWESASDGDCPKCANLPRALTLIDNRKTRRGCFALRDEKGVNVAEIYQDSLAPVLAAAPELLAGLQGALEVIEARVRNCEINDWQAKLRLALAAIAKATQ